MKISSYLICTFFIFLLISSMGSYVFSDTFKGLVIDSSSSGNPVPGVLVSSGYGLHRTITDSSGHFTLDVPVIHSQYKNRNTVSFTQTVTWNINRRVIDLSKATEVSEINIYSLNGKRIWRACHSVNSRTITSPSMVPGIYLISFILHEQRMFNSILNTVYNKESYTFDAPSHKSPAPLANAHSRKEVLLFRHDNFYPLDQECSTNDEELVIKMNKDPRSTVFDQYKVHTYSFTVSKEDSLTMEHHALAEKWVPAEFSYNGVSFGKVGLRYKGSSAVLGLCFDTLGNRNKDPGCRNISLKIKFNEYADTARFYSLKRLNLHSTINSGSKMDETIAYALFREAGIYASRTAISRVVVNGISRGIFTAVEEPDGQFTKSRWPQYGEGNLYKEAWPSQADPTYYSNRLKTNNAPEDNANVIRMVNFYSAINSATPATFVKNIAPFMDLDYWLRFIVVDRAIHNNDGIMACYNGSHSTSPKLVHQNHYFYEDESPGGKLWLIPWDFNWSLHRYDPYVDLSGVPDWNIVPENCDPVEIFDGLSTVIPPNCDNLIKLTAASLWETFVALGEQFLSTTFNSNLLNQRISRLKTLIGPLIDEDPWASDTTWKKAVDSLGETMGILCKDFDDHIHKRVPAGDTSEYLLAFPSDSGFLPNRLNNFEFDPATPVESWAYGYTSHNSKMAFKPNTGKPLWGTVDMLCSFVLNPVDLADTAPRWATAQFSFNKGVDCSGLSAIQVDLKCDAPRSVRIELTSDVYYRHGGIYKYGWTRLVGSGKKQYTFSIDDVSYPALISSGSPELLDSVLLTLTGITVNPHPRTVPISSSDIGFVQIDNIRFVGVK